jgi:hypothetical protein
MTARALRSSANLLPARFQVLSSRLSGVRLFANFSAICFWLEFRRLSEKNLLLSIRFPIIDSFLNTNKISGDLSFMFTLTKEEIVQP